MIGRPLVAGAAHGPLLRLDAPVSFWGGVDPVTGRIIDRSHPQHGATLSGQVVAMAGSRGSSGTPGVLGEALRRGTGPAALVITKADINLVAGCTVAGALYGARCPIVLVDKAQLDALVDGAGTTLGIDGSLTQESDGS